MGKAQEQWQPKRMIFYPDGHRRWAKEQLSDNSNPEAIEEKRLESYHLGAETCIKVINEFADAGGEGVDIFLTRPATYATDLQGRTSKSLNSIHDVIRTDLVQTLANRKIGLNDAKKVRLDAYTRADLERDAMPPSLTNKEQIESWNRLMGEIKNVRRQLSENDFIVNLLINYDGHIENGVVDRLLHSSNLDTERVRELRERLLPMSPSYDMWLRTAPDAESSVSFRMNCGPTRPLAETSMIMIPKFSPDVTNTDIRTAIETVISFRRDKKHVVQPIIEGNF